jgi:hypothetical protein
MAEYKFHVRQPAPSELVDKLLSVVEEVSPDCMITSFYLATNSGSINYLPGNQHVKVSAFKNRNDQNGILSFLVTRPFLDVTSLSLNTNDNFNFTVRTDKGFYIGLNTTGDRDSNVQKIAPVTDALNKHFDLLRQQEALESALPDAEKEAIKTARTLLLEFTSQAARLASLSAANTERMNDVIIAKTKELDERYEQKNKALEDANLAKNKDLADREDDFRKEKAGLDARENTVVRRDLLAKIEKILGVQKNITITAETLKKRQPIHFICLATMGLGLCFIAAFGYKTFTDPTADLHHIIPLSTGIVLFVSTAIFYIRWNDLWFKEHANAEFENRKFYVDVVRASWIAELLFEWKDKKEVPFPDQLITSYTTGLFQNSDIVKTTKHPFDDLKSLAGSVSEIKFTKKDGFSLKKKTEQE